MRNRVIISIAVILFMLTGLTTTVHAWSQDTDLSAANASFQGEDASDYSGFMVSGAGDVNGDGYDDFLIGAHFDDDGGSNAGQTYLILGDDSGWSMDNDLSNADASFRGEDLNDLSGYCVSGAGDVNGDGYDDILIGAIHDEDGGDPWAGQTYLILGKSSGWAMDADLSNADASFWGESSQDFSGYSVSGAGDVNGDGYDDIIIGAYGDDDGGGSAGQTYIVFGKASGWAMDFDLSNADASFKGEDIDDMSGRSVSGAGDVNGDGFDDILIGAYGDEDGGNQAGQTYLILGSGTPTDWNMDTDLSNADASFWGEFTLDYSGWSVSGAGDVNGDGYDDILIGAYGNDEGGSLSGQTYLILGSGTPSDWAMDIDLSNADASFLGEDDSDNSGWSVSGTGDVNGDGFDDILIGAYEDEDGGSQSGQTYIVFGKSTGWAMDTSLSQADCSFIGEDGGDHSGHVVSGAGDVNGDGFDDLIIGAYGNDHGGGSAGQTYLILSDTTGIVDGTYKNHVPIGSTAPVHFPAADVTVDFFVGTSTDGFLTVTEHNNQNPGGYCIDRYWSINSSGLSSYKYDITFKYADSEIAETGGMESELQLFKRDGYNWESVPSTVNLATNEITAANQSSFSDWAIGKGGGTNKTLYVKDGSSGDGSSWANAFGNLQAALNLAFPTDEIWVASGTYTPTELLLPGTPQSASFRLKNNVSVYGGFPDSGNPVWGDRNWDSNPTVLSGEIGDPGTTSDNCFHVFFHSTGLGLDETAVLDGFTVASGNANGNVVPHWYGGGMYNNDSSPKIENVSFIGNSASIGGAVYNDQYYSSFSNCNFYSNSASYGGGIMNLQSTIVLSDCVFEGNAAATNEGGAIRNWSASGTLTNCAFYGNTAITNGGAIANHGSTPKLVNCVFSGNTAAVGGAIRNYTSTSVTTNCTFYDNVAASAGGAIQNQYCNPIVTNSILWGSTPDEIFNNSGTPVVTYSDVQGGYPGVGNISGTPMFTDPGNNDFHLLFNSPCIEIGSNAAVPAGITHDFEGDDRIIDGDSVAGAIVDMGIDEFYPDEVWVDDDWDGSSPGDPVGGHVFGWDAFSSIGEAIDYVNSGVVTVASGTYAENIELKDDVELIGAGTASCTIDGTNGIAVIADGVNAAARIEGFTITNDSSTKQGGGMVCITSSVYIVNCHFKDCSSDEFGGGIYIAAADPTIIDCVFDGNTSTGANGGGIYSYGSNPVLLDCVIMNNTCSEVGAGIYIEGGAPILNNCLVTGNSTSGGGGAYIADSSPVITNCTFQGNICSKNGGAVTVDGGDPVITNCIFWGDSPDEIKGSPVITYSNIQGGYSGNGNISGTPMFANPAGGNFHLLSSSPCIDSGSNAAAAGIQYDFDGDDRIIDGGNSVTVDMGIDEYMSTAVMVKIYVALQGTGRPSPDGWKIPMSVDFFHPGSDVMSDTPVLSFTATASGEWISGGTKATVTVGPVELGTYDITADSNTTLLNVKRSVPIA